MKFVLATHNPGKLKEMADILSGLGVEVVSPADVGISVDVEETGTTFAENAMLKAKAICAASGLPAIADDSGLCVDALNGAPGVYSARYGGEGLDDTGRYRLLLENMKGQMPRTAKFVSVITCCFPNGDVLTARGECPGTIAFAPQGEGGVGCPGNSPGHSCGQGEAGDGLPFLVGAPGGHQHHPLAVQRLGPVRQCGDAFLRPTSHHGDALSPCG